jgi:hypothetical protein
MGILPTKGQSRLKKIRHHPSWMGFEPTFSVFQLQKAAHVSDRTAKVWHDNATMISLEGRFGGDWVEEENNM